MVGQPFISVIIPTRGRGEQLRQCLASLVDLTYPRDRWEVIVAEDGDEQPPDRRVEALGERLPFQHLQQPHAGCGIARNTGAAKARPSMPGTSVAYVNALASIAILVGAPLVGLSFSLESDGRVGFIVVGALWALTVLALPSRRLLGLEPAPSQPEQPAAST